MSILRAPNCLQTARLANKIRIENVRHATLLRRPKRPYTFTQLVILSDGSSFLHRTTSPVPVYKSTKDIRNSPLWNPSSQKLLNMEQDEAGRLSAFRSRFGRSWDALDRDSARNLSSNSQNDALTGLVGDFGKSRRTETGTKGASKLEGKNERDEGDG